MKLSIDSTWVELGALNSMLGPSFNPKSPTQASLDWCPIYISLVKGPSAGQWPQGCDISFFGLFVSRLAKQAHLYG